MNDVTTKSSVGLKPLTADAGISLGLGLTNECNLTCSFCYRDPTRADRLSLDQVKAVMDRLPVRSVNLGTGAIQWNVPLGAFGGVAGSPQLGGPIVTAGGLVFIGATLDRSFRAFDAETGRELWTSTLPAGARATPMTYEAGGRQFVVIAAGGSDRWGFGDAVIAFALPK